MVSYWEDFEAIRAFAGPAPHIAVRYPGDSQFDLISDPICTSSRGTNNPNRISNPVNIPTISLLKLTFQVLLSYCCTNRE